MRKLIYLSVFAGFISIGLAAQEINLTFSGTGNTTIIESVTATNMSTNESITLPGNETLVLSQNTGVLSIGELSNTSMVFPNPFSGTASIIIGIQSPQSVYINVQNLVGQVMAQTTALVQPGDNEFSLSVAKVGIYLISLTSDRGTVSYKVICTEASGSENSIHYTGGLLNSEKNQSRLRQKSTQTEYTFGYTEGDIIHYRCESGIYTTIFTDSPNESKNYEVGFVACTDLDGKNYSIVHIGDQTWMAENLAYLPTVNVSEDGAAIIAKHYVYGYEGTNVSSAKETDNYETYGALYNLEAAKTVCPSGWHLPSDDEWKELEEYLGMSSSDVEEELWRNSGNVGKKLKSTSNWQSDGNGDNSNGFYGLPGGYRYDPGGFTTLGEVACFWSSTENDSSEALFRGLGYDSDGVDRENVDNGVGFSVRCIKD